MSKSTMVVATKYILKTPISVTKGTWDKNGTKEDKGTKIVARSYVEDRNSHDNNEIYVIDEKATDEMLELKEENMKLKAKEAERANVSTADLIDVIVNKAAEEKVSKKPSKK